MVLKGVDLPENPPEYPNEANDESTLLSFVVRLWKEESSEDQQAVWRGHITCVPNGERYYFTDIKDIPDFITARLSPQP